MRAVLVVCLALAVSGCGVEVLTTTAIQGELQKNQLQTVTRQLTGAREFSSKLTLENAIQTYYGEKGVYPPSLDTLVPEYLPEVPKRPDGGPFGYDPATGAVLEHPSAAPAPAMQAPAPISATDLQLAQQLRQAVGAYAAATGYLPPSLQALVPQYIAFVPTAADGRPYLYDPRTGAVTHPAQAGLAAAPAAPVPAPGRAPGAMAGTPMTEAMTGLGVQAQLDSMSQSGASGAGSRARAGASGIEQSYSDRQQRALDDLGY